MKTATQTTLVFGALLAISVLAAPEIANPAHAQPEMGVTPNRDLVPIGGGFREKSKKKDEAKKSEYQVAQGLMSESKYDEAVPMLQRVVADDPRNADAWNDLGLSHQRLGRNAEALADFEHALAISPARKDIRANLGNAHLAMGNLPKAEEQLAQLKTLCTAWCQEAQNLEGQIAEYKAGHPA